MGREQVLADRYRLLSPLGRGGMGQVWEAVDTRLDRKVAVKLLTAGPFDDIEDSYIQRFTREASVTAELAHPGVPAIFDSGTYDGGFYLVMELIGGCTVADLVAEHGPLPVPWAAGIAGQVAAVLAIAHQRGVLHRDIKPQNVMVTSDGAAKILDFGIAGLSSQRLTSTGVTIGTPGYIAPEQLHNRPATPQSDLYALGCLLYEMLAGKPVFSATSPAGLIHMHLEDTPAPLRRYDVPQDLVSLLRQLLAKEPGARPASARQVCELLLPYIGPPGPLGDVDPAAGHRTGAHLYPQLLARLVAAGPWLQPLPVTRQERQATAYPPHPGYPVVPQAAPAWPQGSGGSYSAWWTFRHSLWVLPTMPLGGIGAFISFGYVALRHQRATWGIVAGAYLAEWITGFVCAGATPNGSAASTVGVLLILASWPVAFAHAVWVNFKSHLPLLAARGYQPTPRVR